MREERRGPRWLATACPLSRLHSLPPAFTGASRPCWGSVSDFTPSHGPSFASRDERRPSHARPAQGVSPATGLRPRARERPFSSSVVGAVSTAHAPLFTPPPVATTPAQPLLSAVHAELLTTSAMAASPSSSVLPALHCPMRRSTAAALLTPLSAESTALASADGCELDWAFARSTSSASDPSLLFLPSSPASHAWPTAPSPPASPSLSFPYDPSLWVDPPPPSPPPHLPAPSPLLLPAADGSPASTLPSPSPALSPGLSAPRFWVRKVACQVCHSVKERCEGGRPCVRCVRLGHTANCIDRASKRGAGRGTRESGWQQLQLRAAPPPPISPEQRKRRRRLAGAGSGESGGGGESEEGWEEGEGRRGLSVSGGEVRWASNERLLSERWSGRSPSSNVSLLPPSLSLSCSSTSPAVDGARLSESLLAAHYRWLGRYHELGHGGVRKPDLREKLQSWQWVDGMLTPEDADALIHSARLRPTWFTDLFGCDYQSLLVDAVSALVAHTAAAFPAGEPSVALQRQGRDGCDGRRCHAFCPFFRALLAATQAVQSWQRSPHWPLSDQPDLPNHPLLVIRHLHDDDVAQRQQRALDAAGVRVARRLIGRLQRRSQRLSDAPLCSAGGAEDGAAEDWTLPHPACPRLLAREDEGEEWLCAPTSPPLSSSLLRLELSMSVQVNGAFERLLGHGQAELRHAFMSYGEAALFIWFRADAWPQLMDVDKEVKWARRREFRLFSVCLTKRQKELPCLVHCLSQFDALGRPRVSYWTFLPLPDASSCA